jgi:hypothetical protein
VLLLRFADQTAAVGKRFAQSAAHDLAPGQAAAQSSYLLIFGERLV